MISFTENFYKKMFFVGALWNLSFAIPGLLFPSFVIGLMYGPAMDQSLLLGNYYAYWMYMFWFLTVLVFGVGYYMVSRDILKNHGIVWLAVFGKTAFFLFLASTYFLGKGTILVLLGGLGDFSFTILFLMFLSHMRAMK